MNVYQKYLFQLSKFKDILFVVFISLIFIISGCKKSSNHLVYVGDDQDKVSSQNIVTSVNTIPVFTKHFSDHPHLSIGGFHSEQGAFLGVIIKIDNTGSTNISITPKEFRVKTIDNYKLRPLDPDRYIQSVIRNAENNLASAKEQKVQKKYVVDSSTYTSGSGYLSTNTNYLNSYSNTNAVLNTNSYSSTNTAIKEVDDPWSSLGKSIAVSNANNNNSKMVNYALEVDAHALRKKSTVESDTWSYFYLFFEKPKSYPINLYYKKTLFKFTPENQMQQL